MLTSLEFRTALQNINRTINLDPDFRPFRIRSSIIPLYNAVSHYNLAKSPANMLAIYRSAAALPQVKRVKYRQALNQLGANMGDEADCPILAITVPNPLNGLTLSFAKGWPAGAIDIQLGAPGPDTDFCFQGEVVMALDSIVRLPHGRILLQRLTAHNWRTVIYNGMDNSCLAGINPLPGMATPNWLYMALNGNNADVGNQITAALTGLHPPGNQDLWLATQVDNCPICKNFTDSLIIPSQQIHNPGWISNNMIANWRNQVTVFPNPLQDDLVTDAKQVLNMVLQAGASPNLGVSSSVKWNPAKTLLRDGRARPPYIGLAHELIHAMHNADGDQPGIEGITPGNVLYEYICVGLGLWDAGYAAAHNLVTENVIRAEAHLAARTYY